MLSNPLHRYSPYHNPAAAPAYNNHLNQGQMNANADPNAFGSFRPESSYGFQQLDQHLDQGMAVTSPPHLTSPGSYPNQKQHQYAASSKGSGTSGPVRRRISRACDQCNQLRTKCDGRHPCTHCVGTCCLPPSKFELHGLANPHPELSIGCEYMRQKKKRGKASRKDLAAKAAAQPEGPLRPTVMAEQLRSEQMRQRASPGTPTYLDGPAKAR